MKANVPEKIYIEVTPDGKRYYRDVVKEHMTEKSDIEYTSTNAFIEKACSGIEKLLSGYIIRNFHIGSSYDIDILIEDFKNYMKGE